MKPTSPTQLIDQMSQQQQKFRVMPSRVVKTFPNLTPLPKRSKPNLTPLPQRSQSIQTPLLLKSIQTPPMTVALLMTRTRPLGTGAKWRLMTMT